MSAFQPKAHLISFTRLAQGRLTNDLNALSDEQATASPGGAAQTAVHTVAECAMVNALIANYLTFGEPRRIPAEERDAHLAAFDTKAKAIAYLTTETDRLIAALEAMDEAKLGEETTAIFNRPVTLFATVELPAAHMMYHDGQLNYIQTLHGDKDIHW